jgi:hypothetical protein
MLTLTTSITGEVVNVNIIAGVYGNACYANVDIVNLTS